MSKRGGGKRPTKLVNLSGDEDRSSSPVNIPPKAASQNTAGGAKSAPSGRHRGVPYSSSLLDPVIEDADVMISSSVQSDSSTMDRRRDAARGGLGEYSVQHYGATEKGTGVGVRWQDESGAPELEQSTEIADDYVKIAHRHKREDHGTTNIETAVHVLKGNIGTGLLALPLAIKNAGLIVGALGLLIMGVIATHCMLQLVSCARELCRRMQVETLDYAEVARFAVLQHTNRHIWGKIASIVVNIFLLITQFGFCAVYFVFMADNLNQVFKDVYEANFGACQLQIWIAILLIPMIILSWIRNLDELASLSMVANICILIALVIIFSEEINAFVTSDRKEKAWVEVTTEKPPLQYAQYATLALFFGQVIYAFEGIGVVLPLENKMKTPRSAHRVLTSTMIIIILLYVVFGVLGYIVYGDNIKGSITLNLNGKNAVEKIFFNIAKLFYSYAILSSFLLQFYVPMDFLEPPLLEKLKVDRLTYRFPRHHKKLKFLITTVFRSILVLFTAIIAFFVPDLDDLISLIGAVASSGLALIFPPVLSILVFWRIRREISWLGCLPWPVWVTKDILIALLGAIGSIFGTYSSIKGIVDHFSGGGGSEDGSSGNATCFS